MRRLLLSLGVPASILVMGVTAGIGAAETAPVDPGVVVPGTVLQVSVVGIPGFRYEISVDPSGELSIPLLEPIQATEMTLGDLRSQVRRSLATKTFRQILPDGEEIFLTASADEVQFDVVAYPPVFVNGDVASAGAVDYRPGMTVRQAVALAGGYDVLRYRTANPFLEQADLRSEYALAWTEYLRQKVRISGLQALREGEDLDGVPPPAVPLPDTLVTQIFRTEVARVEAAGETFRNEVDGLKSILSEADNHLAALQTEYEALAEALEAQQVETDRIRDLLERGAVTANRLTDEQRQLVFTQERSLSTLSQIAFARKAREEASRAVQSSVDQRQMGILEEIQDATVQSAILESRIGSLDDKLAHLGTAAERLPGRGRTTADITLHRMDERNPVEISGDEDSLLQAGDVIEIVLETDIPGAG